MDAVEHHSLTPGTGRAGPERLERRGGRSDARRRTGQGQHGRHEIRSVGDWESKKAGAAGLPTGSPTAPAYSATGHPGIRGTVCQVTRQQLPLDHGSAAGQEPLSESNNSISPQNSGAASAPPERPTAPAMLRPPRAGERGTPHHIRLQTRYADLQTNKSLHLEALAELRRAADQARCRQVARPDKRTDPPRAFSAAGPGSRIAPASRTGPMEGQIQNPANIGGEAVGFLFNPVVPRSTARDRPHSGGTHALRSPRPPRSRRD